MHARLNYLISLIGILLLFFIAPLLSPVRAQAEKDSLPEAVRAALALFNSKIDALPALLIVPPGSDLRLQKYQELARKRNLPLMIAQGTVRSDEEQLRADLAALFPQFDFNADYSRSRQQEDYFTQWLAQFTMDQPLWDGQLWGTYRQQRAQVSYSQFSRDGVLQSLDYEIAQAYYNLVRYNQAIDENMRQVTQLNDQLRIIREMLAAGSKTKADFLRAENALLEELNFLVSSIDQARLQIIEFNRILHLPPDTRISLHQLGQVTLLLPEFEACLARGFEERPDIRQSQALVQVAEAGVTLASQNFFPTVGVQGAYGWQDADDDSSGSSNRAWSLGATVSLPIFHSTQNWSLLGAARELERNARTELAQVRDRASAEIGSTVTTISDTIVQIQLLQKNAEYAQNLWEVEKELYSQGTIITSDLYQSFNILLEVRLSLINTICDYLTLMSQLQKEIGGGALPPPLLSRGDISITTSYQGGEPPPK